MIKKNFFIKNKVQSNNKDDKAQIKNLTLKKK